MENKITFKPFKWKMSQKIGASCWRYKHFRGKVLLERKNRKITTFSHSDSWVLLSSTSYNSWIYWILRYEFSLNIFWIWYYLLSSSRQPTLSVIRLSKIFILHRTFDSQKYIATIKIWWLGVWVYKENTKRCELD